VRVRRRERRNADGDETTHAHNTLSAETQQVSIFYPFHPLRGLSLQVIRKPKRGDGAVTVMDAAGRRLKIPVWMLLPDSADVQIVEQAHLNKEALLGLTTLLAAQLDFKDIVNDNLPQTVVNGRKGGQRGATTTSGPEGAGMRNRVDRGKRTNRTDRSHGPRSGGGLSSGRRKS